MNGFVSVHKRVACVDTTTLPYFFSYMSKTPANLRIGGIFVACGREVAISTRNRHHRRSQAPFIDTWLGPALPPWTMLDREVRKKLAIAHFALFTTSCGRHIALEARFLYVRFCCTAKVAPKRSTAPNLL